MKIPYSLPYERHRVLCGDILPLHPAVHGCSLRDSDISALKLVSNQWRIVVGCSVWPQDVPGAPDRRRREEFFREVALANLAQAMEEYHVFAQVRGRASERELGYNCSALRRQVSSFIP